MTKKVFIGAFAAFFFLFGTNSAVFSAQIGDEINEAVLFIVDFSNSMSEKFRGVNKIDMVLDTIDEI